MIQKSFFMVLSLVFFVGCAQKSAIVPMGKDTYMISHQAATGFSGSGTLKAEALSEANGYCVKQNKVLQVMNTVEAQPPYIFGNYPKAEITFMCLYPNDPDYVRTKMKKEADTAIEINK